MNLIYITNDFPPKIGGMEINAFYTYKHLYNWFNIILITQKEEEEDNFIPDKLKKNIIRFNFPKNYLLKNLYLFVFLFFLKFRYNFDFILLNTWSPFGLTAILFKIIFNTKYFITAHGLDVLEPLKSKFYSKLMKIIFTKSALILPVSNFTYNKICELEIKKEKIKIIPNGIEPEDFLNNINENKISEIRNKYCLQENFVLITVSRLVERKGHLLVLEALKLLLKKGYKIKYLIIGEGEFKQKISDYINKNNLSNNVFLCGYVSFEDLKHFYYSADLFVMPSFEITEKGDVEGFGISFLEANICSLPVIGYNSGGISDVIKNNVNGILLNNYSAVELSEKIEKFIDDKSFYNYIKNQTKEYVIKNFTWSKNIEKLKDYLLIYKNINVLYLNHRYEIGGGEISLKQMINNINKKYKKINLYFAGDIRNKFWNDLAIEKEPINFTNIIRFNFFGFFKLIKIIIKNNINIIHCNTTRTVFYAVLAKLILINKVKIIWHNRGTDKRTKIEKILSFFVNKMIAISEAVKNQILEQGVNPEKVIRIYNGIDFKFLDENIYKENLFVKNNNYFYIGIIGRLTIEKNHITLLKAIKKIIEENKNIRLVICGDDEFGKSAKKNIFDFIEKNNLSEYIIYYNHIYNLKELLRLLDLVVLPSTREAFGRIIIEAMYYKIPVIASAVDGIKEIIKDNENGLLYEPADNYEKLAEKINLIIINNELRKKLITIGYQTAIKFDISNHIKEIFKQYILTV